MRERQLRHPHVSSDWQSNEWVFHLRLSAGSGRALRCRRIKVPAPRWARAYHFWSIR